jgi:hypothetical protein
MLPGRHLALALLLTLPACKDGEDSATPDADDTGPAEVAALSWTLHEEIASLVTVSFELSHPAEAWVEFRPVGDPAWMSSPARPLEAGLADVLLLGIPYESDFEARLVTDFGEGPVQGELFTGSTGALPEDMPLPQVHSADPARYEPTGRYLITSVNQAVGGWVTGDFWKVIIDRQGRVVWALLTPDHLWTTYMRVAQNGEDLLYDAFSFWYVYDSGAVSRVDRIKIDGSLVHSYATPGGQHAYADLPDGSIAWGASGFTRETLEIVDMAGEQTTLWDCADFHASQGISSMCMSNSLSWDPVSDSFLYSFYTTDTVVQVSRETGETMRVFGAEYGDYAIVPAESAFFWQHGVILTEQGTLLLSTHTSEGHDDPDQETVAREYEVDDTAMELRELASFGVGDGYNADTAGEAHRLANGNTLHNLGSYGRLREFTPDGTVVWDVDWRIGMKEDNAAQRLIGRSVFVEDLYAFAP